MSAIKRKIVIYLQVLILGSILSLSYENANQVNLINKQTEVEKGKKQVIQVQDNKYYTATTDDGMITFTIANEGKFPRETVNRIIEELNTGYILITKELGIRLDEEKAVMVNLKEGVDEDISGEADFHSLDLYEINQGTYPLIHELTHVLTEPKTTTSKVLSEGVADYISEKFESWYPMLNYDIQIEMKFFRDHHVFIPLEDLFNKDLEYKFLRPDYNHVYPFISYREGHSLTKYLIKTYGVAKYMKVLKSDDAVSEIKKQYNLSLQQLETDWLASLDQVEIPKDAKEDLNFFLDKINFTYPEEK